MVKTVATLPEAVALFKDARLTISTARTWTQNDGATWLSWLFSVESDGPSTYGHPRLEVLVRPEAAR